MKNRRIGPDTVMNIISGISILSWVIVGVAFIIIAMNNPSGIRGSGQSGNSWMTTTIYALFVFLIILSITGIFFNMTRLKRKTDKMRITPIISGILAIVGLIIMSIK